jgi:hypothetical protein
MWETLPRHPSGQYVCGIARVPSESLSHQLILQYISSLLVIPSLYLPYRFNTGILDRTAFCDRSRPQSLHKIYLLHS